MSKENVKFQLAKMYAMWGHQLKIDETMMQMRNMAYYEALSDIDDAALNAAVNQLVAESEFFPTVAAIRKKCASLQRAAEGGEIDPTEALGIVLRMAGAIGREASEMERRNYLADKLPGRVVDIATATINAMQWKAICNEPEERMDTMRAQWRSTFNAIQARKDDFTSMTPEVRGFIAALSAKLSMDRAKLEAPKKDEDDEEEDYGF